MINAQSVYQCPQCGGKLNLSVSGVTHIDCTFCRASFTISNCVVDFSPIAPNFLSGDGEYDKEMETILEDSLVEGWYEALRRLDENSNTQSRLEYAASMSRIDFKFLLPLTKDACVLDIGGGHGLISTALARSVAQVYTIEKIRSQAEFIAVRAKQDSIANLTVACGGANCIFPYKSASFDLIVANGVFEWVGYETSYEKVAHQQKLFLLEIARMLKPGGVVWLTTKNKYSLSMILSRTINNNYIPLISILPDDAINFIAKCFGKGEYLSGLKYVNGYLNLFKSCGFKNKSIWVPLPSVRYPAELVAFNEGHRCVSPANYRHAGLLTRVFNMIVPWSITKRCSLNHAFVLQKENASAKNMRSIIERITDTCPETSGGKICSLFCPQSSSASSAVIANVTNGMSTFIVKLSRYESGNFLSREKKNISTVKQLSHNLGKYLPDIVGDGNIEGFQFLIIRHYIGNSTWSNRLARGITRTLVRKPLVKKVFKLLTELAQASKLSNNLSFLKYVEEPFEKLLKDKVHLRDFSDKCKKILRENWQDIPLILTHGDMHIGNIIIQKIIPLEFKILDWESASNHGLPCVDLYRFTESLHMSPKDSATLMNMYCSKLSLIPKTVGALVFLQLVQSWDNWQTNNEMGKTAEWAARNEAFDRKVKGLDIYSSLS